MKLVKNLKLLIGKQAKTRIHHYLREENGNKARLHMRIDPDGHGTLIVNANRVVHFNPTAALMANLALENTPEPEVIRKITKTFHVDQTQASDDYNTFLVDIDGGLGVDIWFIFAEAQYQFGLSKLYKDAGDGKLVSEVLKGKI